MSITGQVALMLGLFIVIAAPTFAQNKPDADPNKIDIPIRSSEARDGTGPRLSFGSVGMESRAGDSRMHDNFNIPAERSSQKAPGFTVKIPLGN